MEIFLTNYLKNSEELLAAAGWATRSDKCGAEFRPSEKETADMIKYAREMKLSSVLDIPFFVFSLKDVSRSFTHQWVRYRVAAHMQQSLRFVTIGPDKTDWFVIPPSVSRNGAGSVMEYVNSQKSAAGSYRKLIDAGVPVEDARFALPIGTKTHITTAMNCEELLHVFSQRCCTDAQWEIRIVAYALLAAGMLVSPMLFDGSGPHCISENACRGSHKGTCKKGAEETIKRLRNIVASKSAEFGSMESGWIEIDLTDVIGYRAPQALKKEVASKAGHEVALDIPVIVKIRK